MEFVGKLSVQSVTFDCKSNFGWRVGMNWSVVQKNDSLQCCSNIWSTSWLPWPQKIAHLASLLAAFFRVSLLKLRKILSLISPYSNFKKNVWKQANYYISYFEVNFCTKKKRENISLNISNKKKSKEKRSAKFMIWRRRWYNDKLDPLVNCS